VNGGQDSTEDALFGGRLVLHQLARGYRTNVDALLLAAFVASGPPRTHAVDLGAGVGPLGLSLLHFRAAARVTLVEVDAAAAALCRHNVQANGFESRATVVAGDVRAVSEGLRGAADLVVSNPPYFAPGQGRVPLDERRALARMGELEHFARAARTFAGRRARVAFVYPAASFALLVATFARAGLQAKRARFVHTSASSPARVVLVEAAAGKPGGLAVQPPLVERDASGAYALEMKRLLDGEIART
jgi:tRNA1Val (adenine37-N6)-methyltransferase